MNEQAEAAKKSTLLMIPYGLYVLGVNNGGDIHCGTVNWVTQTSFKPPLVAVGVKKDSGLYPALKGAGKCAISFLESGQKGAAFAFFKPTTVDGNLVNGQEYETSPNGSPVITSAPAWVEAEFRGEVDLGDHSCVVVEVVNAVSKRDAKVLTLEECGVKYGG
ncbi:MAG: flavin reductase family protein [Dehalococcoidia bacterium]